jgi:hypothetical protein
LRKIHPPSPGKRANSAKSKPRSGFGEAEAEGFRPRKGLQLYPFDAGGGKRYKRKARFPALAPEMRPKKGKDKKSKGVSREIPLYLLVQRLSDNLIPMGNVGSPPYAGPAAGRIFF